MGLLLIAAYLRCLIGENIFCNQVLLTRELIGIGVTIGIYITAINRIAFPKITAHI